MNLRNLCAILFPFLLFTKCKLTEQSVTGKWLSGNDTLFVNQNHTFIFADRKDYYLLTDSVEKLDTSFVYSTGTWTVTRKTLYLAFDQDKKVVFGNCDQLWNWKRFFSNYKLIRPKYCYEKSNRFISFTKASK